MAGRDTLGHLYLKYHKTGTFKTPVLAATTIALSRFHLLVLAPESSCGRFKGEILVGLHGSSESSSILARSFSAWFADRPDRFVFVGLGFVIIAGFVRTNFVSASLSKYREEVQPISDAGNWSNPQ